MACSARNTMRGVTCSGISREGFRYRAYFETFVYEKKKINHTKRIRLFFFGTDTIFTPRVRTRRTAMYRKTFRYEIIVRRNIFSIFSHDTVMFAGQMSRSLRAPTAGYKSLYDRTEHGKCDYGN